VDTVLSKYRKYTLVAILFIVLFAAVNSVVYYCFTKDSLIPVRIVSADERIAFGDLSRLSHLNGLRQYVTLSNHDSQEYIMDKKLRSFPVYTIGDSYTDYRDYSTRIPHLLSQVIKTNVYNMTGQTVNAMMDFLASDSMDGSHKPKVVVWEIVERTASSNHMILKNFDAMYAEALKRKSKVRSGRIYSDAEVVEPVFTEFKISSKDDHLKWYDLRGRMECWKSKGNPLNSINLDFLLNNISYYTSGKLLRGRNLVNIAHLKNGDPLLYYENERGAFLFGHANVGQTVEFVARVNAMLKEKGITLIFYVVPDKFNGYYNSIQDAYKFGEDHDFMGKLTAALSEKGVLTFNLLPEFREKIQQGSKDIYLLDDSHWDVGGKRIAVDNIVNELNRLALQD